MAIPSRFASVVKFTANPIRALFRVAALRRAHEIVEKPSLLDQQIRRRRRKPASIHQDTRAHFGGRRRQVRAQPLNILVVDLQRRQVGIGKISIIVRILFVAHRPRLPAFRVEKPRLLRDNAAARQRRALPLDFEFERADQKTKRIEIFDFASCAERLRADAPQRHIGVDAKRPFLHIAVANPQPAQKVSCRARDRRRLRGRFDLRLGDDFQQWATGAVVIDARQAAADFVRQFARILLQMRAR